MGIFDYKDWTKIKTELDKKEKPMSNMETINYLIKSYNIRKIACANKGQYDKAQKNNLVSQGLQNIKKDLQVLQMFKEVTKRKDSIVVVPKITDNGLKQQIVITLDVENDKELICNELIKEWLKHD